MADTHGTTLPRRSRLAPAHSQILSPGANESWIEIGAGHGEMTQSLAGDGRRVFAIEAGHALAEDLQEKVHSGASQMARRRRLFPRTSSLLISKSTEGRQFPRFTAICLTTSRPPNPAPFIRLCFSDSIDSHRDSARSGRTHRPPPRACRDMAIFPRCASSTPKPENCGYGFRPARSRPPPRVKSALVRMTLPRRRRASKSHQ